MCEENDGKSMYWLGSEVGDGAQIIDRLRTKEGYLADLARGLTMTLEAIPHADSQGMLLGLEKSMIAMGSILIACGTGETEAESEDLKIAIKRILEGKTPKAYIVKVIMDPINWTGVGAKLG